MKTELHAAITMQSQVSSDRNRHFDKPSVSSQSVLRSAPLNLASRKAPGITPHRGASTIRMRSVDHPSCCLFSDHERRFQPPSRLPVCPRARLGTLDAPLEQALPLTPLISRLADEPSSHVPHQALARVPGRHADRRQPDSAERIAVASTRAGRIQSLAAARTRRPQPGGRSARHLPRIGRRHRGGYLSAPPPSASMSGCTFDAATTKVASTPSRRA